MSRRSHICACDNSGSCALEPARFRSFASRCSLSSPVSIGSCRHELRPHLLLAGGELHQLRAQALALGEHGAVLPRP
eukprot:5132719-Prymnesium_polylepis.2